LVPPVPRLVRALARPKMLMFVALQKARPMFPPVSKVYFSVPDEIPVQGTAIQIAQACHAEGAVQREGAAGAKRERIGHVKGEARAAGRQAVEGGSADGRIDTAQGRPVLPVGGDEEKCWAAPFSNGLARPPGPPHGPGAKPSTYP